MVVPRVYDLGPNNLYRLCTDNVTHTDDIHKGFLTFCNDKGNFVSLKTNMPLNGFWTVGLLCIPKVCEGSKDLRSW